MNHSTPQLLHHTPKKLMVHVCGDQESGLVGATRKETSDPEALACASPQEVWTRPAEAHLPDNDDQPDLAGARKLVDAYLVAQTSHAALPRSLQQATLHLARQETDLCAFRAAPSTTDLSARVADLERDLAAAFAETAEAIADATVSAARADVADAAAANAAQDALAARQHAESSDRVIAELQAEQRRRRGSRSRSRRRLASPPPPPPVHCGHYCPQLPDPEPYDGSPLRYASFATALTDKAEVDAEQWRSPIAAAYYVRSRLSGHAQQWAAGLDLGAQIEAARKPGLPLDTPAAVIAFVLALVRESFADPADAGKAAVEIRRLRQEGTSFQEFLPGFEALARRAGYVPAQTRQELIASLRPELREVLTIFHGDLNELSYPELRASALLRDAIVFRPRKAATPTILGRATCTHPATPTLSPSIPAAAALDTGDMMSRSSGDDTTAIIPSRPLPTSCNRHTNRGGCPRDASGPLGPRGTPARDAKIALLREYGRCFKCRGLLA